MNKIEKLMSNYGWNNPIDHCEANTPVKALDKSMPEPEATGKDLGGIVNGQTIKSLLLGIKLSDLSLNRYVSEYTRVYSFTFNYDPRSKHVIREEIPVELLQATDEVNFWRLATGKEEKKYKTITKEFGYFSFTDQNKIFQKHFKRWEKNMNDIIPESVTGYTVCIEQTKQGVLHAHAIIYSNNNYEDMTCKSARSQWASISKGKVCAMQNAFAPVKNENHWKKYISKDLEKKL